MILVIGGLNGFIGSNTTEALVQLGEKCVATRHRSTEVPGFLQEHIDRGNVIVEQLDVTSLVDLRRIGETHVIDSIVNVAGGFKVPDQGPLSGLAGYLDMLRNIFSLSQEWKVKRVMFASTGGMYLGLTGRVSEDQPIPLSSPFNLIGYQKIVEVAAGEFTRATGISTVAVRMTGMFGPFQDPSQGHLAPRLVNSALNGTPPNLQNVFRANIEDEIALMYIKDTARAIALLHTTEKLRYNVYNIGADRFVPNRELIDTIREIVPGFKVELPLGHSPFPPTPILDTKRLKEDTGFTIKFDTPSAIEDYVNWLNAGNSK